MQISAVEVWVCSECEHITPNETDLYTLYECGECGSIFSKEANGSSRCADCDKFAGLMTKRGCPNCEGAEMEQDRRYQCPECDVWYASEGAAKACYDDGAASVARTLEELPDWAQQRITALEERLTRLEEDRRATAGETDVFRRDFNVDVPLPRGSTVRFVFGKQWIEARIERDGVQVRASYSMVVEPEASNVVRVVIRSFASGAS